MKLMLFNLDVYFKKIISEKIKTLWTVFFILDPRSKIENEHHNLTPCPISSYSLEWVSLEKDSQGSVMFQKTVFYLNYSLQLTHVLFHVGK